jgi:CheY-like chemotaxis protein
MAIDRRILIADDDAAVRFGAAELLASLGLEVLEAESGEEALAIVRRAELHIALLDMHMPGPSGIEVFTAIRAETPGLPCIFWSGDATDDVARYALRLGASAFLRKPVPAELLRGEVRRVLAHHWGAAG